MIEQFTSNNEELSKLLEYDYVYAIYTSSENIYNTFSLNPILRETCEFGSKLRGPKQYGAGKIDNKHNTHGWPVGIIYGVNTASKEAFEKEAFVLGITHGVTVERYSYKEEMARAKDKLWANLFQENQDFIIGD